jgi:hypothetical protein
VPVLLFTLLAAAAPANPYLEEGRRLVKELQFAEAIEQLRVARQVPELSSTQQLEVLELLGRCQVAEGARADAEASFAQLLALAPNAELDRKLSPKILEVFDAVKQRLYPPDFVRLTPEAARAGQAVLTLVDPWGRVGAVVVLRRSNGAEVTEQPVELKNGRATIELEAAPGQTLEWWVEARDLTGNVLAGFGSAQSPQQYSVPAVVTTGLFGGGPPAPPTPRLQRVSAWLAVAAAVGAGVAGGVLQVRSASFARAARDNTRPPGDWSDTARAAQASALSEATWATGLFVGAGVAGATGVVLFAW